MKPLALTALILLASGLHAAEIYRWVEADGTVVYSDRPNTAGTAERITINTLSSAPPAPTPAAGTSADESAAGAPLGAEIPRESTPAELAENRARNCEAARERNEIYSTAHRLYRELADGEREYLSADEIDAARTQAAADVAAWCD